jgi:AAA domain
VSQQNVEIVKRFLGAAGSDLIALHGNGDVWARFVEEAGGLLEPDFESVVPELPGTREIVGDTRIAPGEGGREMWGEVTEVSHSTITLRPEERSPPMAAPSGLLRRDRRHAIAAIERQQRALDAVEYGRSVRTELVSLLTDPASAGEPETAPVPNFVAALDASKQAAVRAALGSRDVLLVRGPPGTGKTTFITELVLQELRRDSAVRILLASQSNAALDHALGGIHALAPGISLLRVAPPEGEKVAPSGEPFVLTKQLERWKQEAVEKGNRALREWAGENGLVLGEIEAASLLSVLAAGLREREELTDARREAEAGLAELRGDNGRAGQTATVSQLARERQAEIAELREAQEVCSSRNREAVSALVELGQLPARTRARSLLASELEDRAGALLPQDSEALAQARARLRVLADWHARFGLGPAFQAAALARASVVAATCVGLGGLRGAESVEFDLVVVDEASKATAPELLIPLARARRIVLVGDDRQLPPYIEEGVLDEQRLAARSLSAEEVSTPLFTTLAEGLPAANTLTLTHQHRMHPSIGRLVSACFYDDKLSSEPRERPDWLGPLAPRPVTWLTTSAARERSERRRGSSAINELEVRIIARFLRDADARAHAARTTATVAVLSGYAAQRDALEQRIARDRAHLKALTVTCQTVDAFQGQEADIVLLSLTRSNKKGKLGFIRERPRVNVAVSRARDTLVLIGDSAFARAAKGSGELRRVLDHIEAHPDDCTSIKATW